jgi:hypothetical protein
VFGSCRRRSKRVRQGPRAQGHFWRGKRGQLAEAVAARLALANLPPSPDSAERCRCVERGGLEMRFPPFRPIPSRAKTQGLVRLPGYRRATRSHSIPRRAKPSGANLGAKDGSGFPSGPSQPDCNRL